MQGLCAWYTCCRTSDWSRNTIVTPRVRVTDMHAVVRVRRSPESEFSSRPTYEVDCYIEQSALSSINHWLSNGLKVSHLYLLSLPLNWCCSVWTAVTRNLDRFFYGGFLHNGKLHFCICNTIVKCKTIIKPLSQVLVNDCITLCYFGCNSLHYEDIHIIIMLCIAIPRNHYKPSLVSIYAI